MSAKRQRSSENGTIVCHVYEKSSLPLVDTFGVLERDAVPNALTRIPHVKTFKEDENPLFADLWMHFDGKMLCIGTQPLPFVDLETRLADMPWRTFTTFDWLPEYQEVRDRLAVHKLTVVHEELVQRTRKAKWLWVDCREKEKEAKRQLKAAQEKVEQ